MDLALPPPGADAARLVAPGAVPRLLRLGAPLGKAEVLAETALRGLGPVLEGPSRLPVEAWAGRGGRGGRMAPAGTLRRSAMAVALHKRKQGASGKAITICFLQSA